MSSPRKPKNVEESGCIGLVMGVLYDGAPHPFSNVVPVIDDDGDYTNEIRILTHGGNVLSVMVELIEEPDAVDDLRRILAETKH